MSFHDLERAEESESADTPLKQDELASASATQDERARLERLLYGSFDGTASGAGKFPPPGAKNASGRWQPYLMGVAATLFLVGFFNILQPLQKEPAQKNVAEPISSADPFPVTRAPSPTWVNSSSIVPGFSARKMGLTGIIDSRTMSASYYLTLVLKNDSSVRQEGFAKLHLPEGAVVSRVTDWVNGVPQEAAFNSTARVNQAYETVVSEIRDPLLVSLNNDKTVTIKAFPVNPHGGKMKIRLGITAPLTVDESGLCSIEAPYLMSSNFDTSRKEDVHLQSNSNIGFSMSDPNNEDSVSDRVPDNMNDHVLADQFSQAQLEHLRVMTESSGEESEFAVRATHSTKGHYIRFALKKRSDGKGFVADLSRVSKKPNLPVVNDEHAAFRLTNLWAKQEVDRFIRQYDRNAASQVATVFRLVTPVTSAVVLETSRDYGRFGLHRQRYSVLDDSLYAGLSRQSTAAATPATEGTPVLQGATISGIFSPEELSATQSTQSMDSMAPTLQGTTNGTIGPQGSDATYITGVNTAGTMVASDRTIADLVPFANLAMCFAGLFIAIFTFANERGCKWAQLRGFTGKERRST